jgi:hypothetical protein
MRGSSNFAARANYLEVVTVMAMMDVVQGNVAGTETASAPHTLGHGIQFAGEGTARILGGGRGGGTKNKNGCKGHHGFA